MKFIRKNGRIIPIKEKGESDGRNMSKKQKSPNYNKEAKKQKSIGDRKDNRAEKIVSTGGLIGGIIGVASTRSSASYATHFKKAGIGILGGMIAGSLLARAKGLGSEKNREKQNNAEENASWEKKKKAYSKMDKLKKIKKKGSSV